MHASTRLLKLCLSLVLIALPLSAQQIVLNVGSVIGGGPTYGSATYNTGSNPASLAVDEQTGAINVETELRNNYWLGPDGVATSYFVLDLGAAYQLDQIDLFNTHNWESMDRSTKDFTIQASNSVTFVDAAMGYNLLSGVTILSGILPFTSDDPPGANVFTAANGLNTGNVAYRYVSFTFDSYRGIDDSVGHSGGLHEIRLYAVPEPSTYAALAGAIALGLTLVRRRRPAVV